MKKFILLLIVMLMAIPVKSQLVRWNPEDIKLLTQEWTGERTPDGRPKVSEELLERLKFVSMEECWSFMGSRGYPNQFENFASLFENGWEILRPEQVMTGQVVTAQFMPARADLSNYIQEIAKKTGMYTPHTNYAPIYELRDGDVYVADSYGKMVGGTLIGDNLANAIYREGKRGIIFNGSVRDVQGIKAIEGFNGWIRGSDPSAIQQMLCATVNAPIRIGRVTVCPGDVVLAKTTGVIFIPPHLLAELVVFGEYTGLRDQFSFWAAGSGKFKYENERFVDVTTEELDKAFVEWLNAQQNLTVNKQEIFDYMNRQREERARRAAAAGN